MSAGQPKQGWFRRLPTVAKILVAVLVIAVALIVSFWDVIERLPGWLTAALVISVGVSGLVLVYQEDWAREARKEPAHLLLYLLRPLPLIVWRMVMGIIALGIVLLGVWGLVDSLT